jgi:hypothetical protein
MAHRGEHNFRSLGENIDWCAGRRDSDSDADRILPFYPFSYRGGTNNTATDQA